MSRLKLRMGINPIIVKELRSRMRGARAFITLTSVLVLLGGVSYLLYRIALATSYYNPTPLSAQIGQSLFIALAFLELMMVCAIAPAVTAGTISGEEEKLTIEMLLATPLRPISILWGKLLSALSYVFLLVFAAVPMSSLIFTFGGVSLRDMVKALIVIVSVAVTWGVLGLFMSAWLKRTSRATVFSYIVVVALLFGTTFVYAALAILRQAEPPRWILVPNPISALFSAITTASPYGSGPISFFGGLAMGMGGNFGALSGATISQTSIPRPLYHYSLPLFGLLSLVLYLVSSRLVQPTRRWRIGWREALMASGVLLAFLGLVGIAFWSTADRYENALNIFSAPTPVPPMRVEESVRVVQAPAIPLPTAYPVPASEEAYPPLDSSGAGASSGASAAYPLPSDIMLSLEDQAAIYAAAVRQLYAADYYAGNPPKFSVLYVVSMTDDSVGDLGVLQTDAQGLPDALLTGIVEALAELPVEVRWIGVADLAPFDDEGMIVDGVILSLGNLHPQEDGSVLLSAALYYSSRGGGMGKTYLLGQVDGLWQVTGDTGFVWQK